MGNPKTTIAPGASESAVRHHYDVSNEFYALWLDPVSMSYTSAFYEDGETDLGRAQLRKIDYLADGARVRGAKRVLDIGCGWGNLLNRLVQHHEVGQGVGLTLSQKQAHWLAREQNPRLEIRIENWRDHEPSEPYDAIFSVESIEAFARPNLSREEKVGIYRELLERCHRWLVPGGRVSLQMIAYGNSGPEDLDSFISERIFPESDLPRLSEVLEAAEGIFEPVSLRNDRRHYATTLRAWLANLRQNKVRAIQEVGPDVFQDYDRYLRLCVYMFEGGGCDLHRIVFERINHPRKPIGGKGRL